MALEVMVRAATPIPLDVAFRVEPGEMLALVGHSGSGKTTILRTIAGLWRPAQARVVVNGTPWVDTGAGVFLPTHRRRLGMMFQSYALFPHMTAAENVMAAMDVGSPAARRAEAARLLELVNLPGFDDRRPAGMSGGQAQRVALARALARRPQALLLDEPFSAVDRITREKLHAEIVLLRAHLAMPVILVTHDMTEAQMLADRMAVLEEGRVVTEGATVDIMADPDALRFTGVREVASMLRATVVSQDPDGMAVLDTGAGPITLPGVPGGPGAEVRIRVVANDVILSRDAPRGLSAQNIIPGTVIDLRRGTGPGALVRLRVGTEEIQARITRRALEDMALAPGDTVHAVLKSMVVARGHMVRTAGAPHARAHPPR